MEQKTEKKSIKQTDSKVALKELSFFAVTRKRASELVAGAMVLGFAAFMAGYYLGEHNALEQLVHKLESHSFADQVCSSLYRSFDGQESEKVAQGTRVTSDKVNNSIDVENSYQAQLTGFGTQEAADSFVARLANRGILTEVKRRVSQTAKGNSITWYQVVTTTYDDRKQLEQFVENISRDERLKGVRIVTTNDRQRCA